MHAAAHKVSATRTQAGSYLAVEAAAERWQVAMGYFSGGAFALPTLEDHHYNAVTHQFEGTISFTSRKIAVAG
jgi:hypothetical protein